MFVYFIRAGKAGGPIKIGKAVDVDKRLDSLQTGCPFTLSLVAKIPCDSEKAAFNMEAWFHDRFESKRIRGEWFSGQINMRQIENGAEHARLDKDWDAARSEQGGRYYKKGGKHKPGRCKANQVKADRWAAKHA